MKIKIMTMTGQKIDPYHQYDEATVETAKTSAMIERMSTMSQAVNKTKAKQKIKLKTYLFFLHFSGSLSFALIMMMVMRITISRPRIDTMKATMNPNQINVRRMAKCFCVYLFTENKETVLGASCSTDGTDDRKNDEHTVYDPGNQ